MPGGCASSPSTNRENVSVALRAPVCTVEDTVVPIVRAVAWACFARSASASYEVFVVSHSFSFTGIARIAKDMKETWANTSDDDDVADTRQENMYETELTFFAPS